MHTDALAVLDFWFGPADDPGHAEPRTAWFKKDDAFDAQIRTRFGPLIERALIGGIDDWLTSPVDPLPALARVLVLDQFTRNVFRGSARAFAGDPMALQTARALVASGADRALTGVQRQFAYLPFEHAEDLSHQRTAVQLYKQLAVDEPARAGLVEWAQKHLDIVARFGRFPHRNAALGRASTAEEAAFLLTPGSGF
jgi:uncharacterized protein (DUF924 family)